MGKYEKLYQKIIDGSSDANISFEEIVNLLKKLGFEVTSKGSHNIFRKEGIAEKINLQKDGSKAKPYQVRQIRKILLDYQLRNTL